MNENISFKPDASGYLSEESTKSYYSRIGIFCFLIGTVSFLIGLLAELIIIAFFPQVTEMPTVGSIIQYGISLFGIYIVAMPIALLALKPLPKVTPIKEKMKFSHLLASLCVCFTFMQVGSYFSNIIIIAFESVTGKTLVNPVSDLLSPSNLILSAIFVGILFPILEEILFRRILCNSLLALGEKKAIIISAAIFGLIHGNLYQFAYAFLIVLIFGYIYVKTGKLIYTIVFHCIINLYAGVLTEFISSRLPIDEIYDILLDESALTNVDALMEKLMPYTKELAIFMAYSYLMLGLSFAGFIILFVLSFKKKLTFEQGILLTPKKHRFSNFFLNGGVAAAIGYISLSFLYSLFM